MTQSRFYVYEHWRPDTDVCFWVGKGTGDRAYRFKRNAGYDAVVAALSAMGMCVEVRMVASGLSNIEALAQEEKQIKFWRAAGVVLTNRNDGGRGAGKDVSAAQREKLRLANLGKKHSRKTRAKMSASQLKREKKAKGRSGGFKHSTETIEKMRAKAAGRIISAQTREKLRTAGLGKKHTPETRAKMSSHHKSKGGRDGRYRTAVSAS